MVEGSYEQCGFAIERGVLIADAIERGRTEADRLLADGRMTDPGHLRTRSRGSLSGRTVVDRLDFVGDVSAVFADFASDGMLAALAARYLGEPARLFKDKLVTKPPGTAGYGLHQDYMRWQDFAPAADDIVTLGISFDRATRCSGALEVYVGAHGRLLTAPGVVADPDPDSVDETSIVPVELDPGDVVVLHPLLPHRSDYNRSRKPRRMLFCTYTAERHGDLRPEYFARHAEMFRAAGTPLPATDATRESALIAGTMRIEAPEVTVERDTLSTSVRITSTGGEPPPRRFTVDIIEPADTGGEPSSLDPSTVPFVPVAAVTALVLGCDLDVGAPITEMQAAGARTATTLLGRWLDRPPPVITAPIDTAPAAAPAAGVGLFFTRGVDSWSSLLEHRNRVTHLLFLDGVEPNMSPSVRALVRAEHERVARELDLPLVTLRTNARAELDAWCSWELTHGAIMASAALLLAPQLGEVLIASSHATEQTKPWGTHADLDPLWSTPTLTFRHDGRRFTRWEKVERVAASQQALESLHVCWQGSDRNCGRCSKCLVTMSALDTLGALDRCPRFDAPLEIDTIAGLGRRPPGRGTNIVDLLVHLPPGSALAQAWAQTLDPAMLAGTPYEVRGV